MFTDKGEDPTGTEKDIREVRRRYGQGNPESKYAEAIGSKVSGSRVLFESEPLSRPDGRIIFWA
jgi:hypothetical protein